MIIIGYESMSILKDTIWAVIVVPMFAPIMMPIACLRVISPALTKPTVITDVALLLWISMVVKTPTNKVDHDLFVRTLIIDFILLEAILRRLVLSLLIPKIKRANPPNSSIIILKYINLEKITFSQ